MEASKKEPNVLQTYEELKTEFENHACRVDDVLLYPVLDTKNERTLYTLLQLKERFSHLKYSEGKTEHKFVRPLLDELVFQQKKNEKNMAKLYHDPTTYFSNPLKPSPRIQKKQKPLTRAKKCCVPRWKVLLVL